MLAAVSSARVSSAKLFPRICGLRKPEVPLPREQRDNGSMSNQDPDLWEEFDKLKPTVPDRIAGYPGGEPVGFGFRTGVRSAKVALGFAVYALALGTTLVLTGVVVFIAQQQWLLLGLMILIEALFVYGFIRLARQARNRRASG
jgi:hypothetical protein